MRVPTLLAVALASAAAAPASAAPRPRPEGYDVSQRAGWRVWTARSGDGTYRLRLRHGTGRAWTSAVRPSGEPFAVDLGTDAAGHTEVVYPRCEGDGPCRLAVLDPVTARARFLPLAPVASDRAPRVSIHAGVVTYAVRRAPWSTVVRVPADGSRAPAILLERRGVITDLDTGPHGLAYVVSEPRPGVAHETTTVHWRPSPHRRARRVTAFGWGEEGGAGVVSVAFSGRRLVWGVAGSAPDLIGFGRIGWRDLRTGRHGDRPVPGGWLFSAAPDEARPDAAALLAIDPAPVDNGDSGDDDRQLLTPLRAWWRR